ncbi:MAG: DUF2339 domain-containing protein [Candidatus Lindowbacteria bacterium]|nr:DUF2339 domain-containing protein [Candidatus Lindowbacteria bacterium]
MFHLLAQILLAVNFGHYWYYIRGQESTLPYFVGGLMTAAVYFVKASLEEIWYGKEARIEWLGGAEQGPISKPLVEIFDAFYSRVAPYLAHLHAAGGAVILTSQCIRYFPDHDTALALSLLIAGFMLIGLLRRSIPLLMGYLFLQGGLASFVLFIARGQSEFTFWFQWWVATAGLIACSAASAVMRWRMRDAQKIIEGSLINYLALLCPVATAFVYLENGQEHLPLYLAWIASIALIYVHMDRVKASLEKIKDETPHVFAVVSVVAAVAASLLIVIATGSMTKTAATESVWLILWSAVVVAAAGLRRSRTFYLSGMMVLLFCYLSFLDRYHAIYVMDRALAAVWVIVITLAIAWVQDFALTAREKTLSSLGRDVSGILTYVQYTLGLLFLTGFLYHRVSFPWSIAGVSVCAVVLYLITSPMGMRKGALVSFALILLAHGIGFTRFFELYDFPDNMLVPVVVFFAEAVIFERLLVAGGGLEVEMRFANDDRVGKGGQKRRRYAITQEARFVLIVAATAVIMTAIYHSALLGTRWTTAGWSLIGATLIGLGFALRSSSYRRTALVVFTLCLVRVFIVDTRHLSDAYKTLAFITLGLCLVAMAWLYSRFAEDIKKWL